MRPRERREIELRAKCDAGDPRALLLSATPAVERSEVAARYDHAIEAANLDSKHEPTADEIEGLCIQLWRASVAVCLAETAGYRDIVSRYMGGHRVSAGMERAITDAEAATPMPDNAEVISAWRDRRRWRREYIRQRYD